MPGSSTEWCRTPLHADERRQSGAAAHHEAPNQPDAVWIVVGRARPFSFWTRGHDFRGRIALRDSGHFGRRASRYRSDGRRRGLGSVPSRQRVVIALALLAGDAGAVSVLRQVARALVNAAEHVGKQIEGVAGCRASGGSGGMAGGCDELVDTLLQAASGSASSKSIRERGSALLVRIVCDLRLRRGAALFFGALPRRRQSAPSVLRRPLHARRRRAP